ncbi:MAG: hypothetical protein Q9213_000297 [Squamulea squamosa]
MISTLLLIIAALNWAVAAKVGCWRQPDPPAPQHHTTVYRHCFDAIKELAELDKAYAPILFSRKPGLGYKVPERWIKGTCYVHIDVNSEDDEDYISFHEIAVEAGVIAAACVIKAPHLGGTSPVGPKQVMNVSIFGVRRLAHRLSAFDEDFTDDREFNGSAEILR